MLALKSQEKIIERIVRTKTGQLCRAVFLVTDFQGELRVRLLSVIPLSQSFETKNYKLKTKNCPLCLGGKCLKSSAITAEHHTFTEILSPFFNKLEFFVSQPTRAPAYAD